MPAFELNKTGRVFVARFDGWMIEIHKESER